MTRRRLPILCLMAVALGAALAFGAPVQPQDKAARGQDEWMSFLPDSLRPSADSGLGGLTPLPTTPVGGWNGLWPGFEFGVGAAAPLPGLPAPGESVRPGSSAESAFYGPVSPRALGEANWDPLAVLSVGRPATWPRLSAPGTGRGANGSRQAGADVARAGAPASEEGSSDILAIIPEPATLGLLGLGALALLRRRRRAA
jgi:hypothetical protein